jgi:hypothetical protein
MGDSEPQNTAPVSELRWYQCSLRALFAVTTVTAIFFAVGRSCGYVNAMLVLAVFEILLGLKRYRPCRLHLATGLLLAVVAAQVSAAQGRGKECAELWALASMVLSGVTVRYVATRTTKRLGRLSHHAVGLLACLVGAIIGFMGSEAIFEPLEVIHYFDFAWAISVIFGFVFAAFVEGLAAVLSAVRSFD